MTNIKNRLALLVIIFFAFYLGTVWSEYRINRHLATKHEKSTLAPKTIRSLFSMTRDHSWSASARRAQIVQILTENQEGSSGGKSETSNQVQDEPDTVSWIDPDDTALSKSFGLPEFKSKLYPFYHKHSSEWDLDELTLTTFITPNRFDRLKDVVLDYQGPISAVLHVSESDNIRSTLRQLDEMYASHPAFGERLDVHLVTSLFERQLNAWRNYARAYARTKYVMMLDVDLAMRTDVKGALKGILDEDEDVGQGLRDGVAALVVPAFEWRDAKVEPEDWRAFPETKAELTKMYENGTIIYFYQLLSPRGQAPTNHTHYFLPSPTLETTTTTYLVDSWKLGYEPYLIFRKDGPPWCDERFIGFGHNKEACVGGMLLSGMRFWVLKQHFITHRRHPKDGATSKNNELQRNNRLWDNWERDSCIRYIDLLAMRGQLHTAQKSLIDVCSRYSALKVPEYIKISRQNAESKGKAKDNAKIAS